MSRLFVITVASEKGGVGKTTIATNLAVYLKALHEDLPVTIASFDNHFSVDQMFALGPRPVAGVAELLGEAPPAGLVNLGQYGVQYLASARRLGAVPHPPAWLRSRLESLGLDGILILDTRPILDWFTESALLAADLVLTPVKDRAALVNAAALREVLRLAGCGDRLWLVPSLVDVRARLNDQVRVHEYLTFAARERDYQVAEVQISKSPKVESLASGFSMRIRPVLTHARQTAVHGQLRQLAEFVLERRSAAQARGQEPVPALPVIQSERYLVSLCPACAGRAVDQHGYPFFDLRSRRRGVLHAACFQELLRGCEIDQLSGAGGLLVLELAGPGLIDEAAELQLHLLDHADRLVASERIACPAATPFKGVIEGMTGRGWHEHRREWILVAGAAGTPLPTWLTGELGRRRRGVLRTLRTL